MRIETVTIKNFRNIEKATLDTNKQFVVLYGPNGAGKTSILEAVDVLCSLRSFREPSPNNLIQMGFPSCFIEATAQSVLGKQKLLWGYHGSKGRLLQMDGKNIRDLELWFQSLRAILFCPENIDIVKGSPQVRRQFVDRAKFTADPSYLDTVRKYLFVLEQKRELFKKEVVTENELLPWNKQLVEYGSKIISGRIDILEQLSFPFQDIHQQISGGDKATLQMQGVGAGTKEAAQKYFVDLSTKVAAEELKKRQILVGPHKDDLHISLNDMLAKKFASQGQVRSIVVSLKLAELEAAKYRGEKPLFLLDDLSSDLDLERRKKLVEMLADRDSQVWITTTQPNFLQNLPSSRVAKFYVENGIVQKES